MRSLSLRLFTSLALIAIGAVLAPQAQAKDLASRLGVGYRNSFVTMNLPSLATFYYPSAETGLVGAIGVDTAENNALFGLSGAVRRIIFKEEQMNFFGMGQIAVINQEVAADKNSGFELAAGVGGEFFLHGLDSLGLNFETGVGITTIKKTRFRTLGESFLNAGMVFYF